MPWGNWIILGLAAVVFGTNVVGSFVAWRAGEVKLRWSDWQI